MATLTLATVGGKVAASLINQIVNILTVPTAYTPTIGNWNSATTAPTTTGRYTRVGNTVTVVVQSKLGTGALTIANLTVSLPPGLPIDTTGMIVDSTLLNGTVGMTDVSAGLLFGGSVQLVNTTTVRLYRGVSGTAGQLGSINTTAPFTWATLDELSVQFSYPTSA